MFDNGPHIVTSQEAAIDGALFPFFDDMTREEAERARDTLKREGTYYFGRTELGADYCEVSECDCTNPDHLGELES